MRPILQTRTLICGPCQSNDFIRKLWLPRPLITAGRFTRESAIARAEEMPGELPAFGRLFISNVCDRTFPGGFIC